MKRASLSPQHKRGKVLRDIDQQLKLTPQVANSRQKRNLAGTVKTMQLVNIDANLKSSTQKRLLIQDQGGLGQ
jgi:hypothetical protein